MSSFAKSIATIRGDLSNITAPPFVLDTKSAVELPSFWAERPSIFVAPAAADDAAERALLVLKWFISSLRNQQYAGRSPAQGVKKPINAFLGELFLARWEGDQDRDGNGDGAGDRIGDTRLVSEQVSHHPPVTACRVWNEKHGVTAEGYTRQEITFSGSVNIQQIGHATLHLARHNETYLIPLPDIKVKGILTGTPYPELQGTHHIPSTSGYTSTIDFSGKGLFSGSDRKHSFEARVHRDDDGHDAPPLYTVSGHWDTQFVIRDARRNLEIETFDVATATTTPLVTEPLAEQDPWESRCAWSGVREALQHGDMQAAADAKAKVENGQREMRKTDSDGKHWQRLFFDSAGQTDEIAASLARKVELTLRPEDTVAAWRFRRREWEEGLFRKPYHGDLMPDNSRARAAQGGRGGDAVNKANNDDDDVGAVHPHPRPVAGSQISTSTPAGESALAHVNGPPTASAPPQPLGETPILEAETEELDMKNNTEPDETAPENAQVEDFLRDRYSSRRTR